MSALRLSDFPPGVVYTVAVGGDAFALSLDKAQSLSDSGRDGGSFRLEFVGPDKPVLPQSTYEFSRDGVTHDIFIVPIAREAGAIRYEAVFY